MKIEEINEKLYIEVSEYVSFLGLKSKPLTIFNTYRTKGRVDCLEDDGKNYFEVTSLIPELVMLSNLSIFKNKAAASRFAEILENAIEDNIKPEPFLTKMKKLLFGK